jgi:hypothetical protein
LWNWPRGLFKTVGGRHTFAETRCAAGVDGRVGSNAEEERMQAKTDIECEAPLLTPEQFANLGDGKIAYVRAMRSEDVNRLYPEAPDIEPGLTVFALIGADGAPILLADTEEGAIGNAYENDLQMVSLH